MFVNWLRGSVVFALGQGDFFLGVVKIGAAAYAPQTP
ncbi:MAG: hypothetical protein ACI8QI_000680 [Limisphaerales bacterium]|jgi:hypothetical protein